MILLIIFVLVLLVIKITINPIFDQIPLTFHHERWLIVWYNKFHWHKGKITTERTWTKLFCIEK